MTSASIAFVFAGRPIETVTSLACLVDFEAFKKILTYLRERQGGRPTTALLGLARTLKAIAKHQVQMSDQHVQGTARICANYARELEGRVSKSRVRLQTFEDERLLAAVLHLPDRLLEEARHPETSPRKARLLAQVAVAIEIEWHAPLRLTNLVGLNLQRNIQAVMVKGQLRWIVRFDRSKRGMLAMKHTVQIGEQRDHEAVPGASDLQHPEVALTGPAIIFYGRCTSPGSMPAAWLPASVRPNKQPSYNVCSRLTPSSA